jgi:RNA polymerase sigma factor (sigma-70 family)
VQLYTPLVCHWTRRLGLDGAQADALVQEVFARLFDRLPQFHPDPAQGFRGWLWTNTRDLLESRPRQPGTPIADLVGELGEKEHRRYLVHRALELIREEFPPVTWRVFWEFAVVGRPADEVAGALGISVVAVYLARAQVLRRLRTHLAGLLD